MPFDLRTDVTSQTPPTEAVVTYCGISEFPHVLFVLFYYLYYSSDILYSLKRSVLFVLGLF